jgi:predicted nucleic-acid-binding Zn-ribbon protein
MRNQQIDEESTIRIVSNKQMRFEVESFMYKESNDEVMRWNSVNKSNDQIIWFINLFRKDSFLESFLDSLFHQFISSSQVLSLHRFIYLSFNKFQLISCSRIQFSRFLSMKISWSMRIIRVIACSSNFIRSH